MHLLLGAATHDEHRVPLILSDIIEYVQHMGVGLLISTAALHRQDAILVDYYQAADRLHIVLLFVVEPQLSEPLPRLNQSLVQPHAQDHVLRLVLGVVKGLPPATSADNS